MQKSIWKTLSSQCKLKSTPISKNSSPARRRRLEVAPKRRFLVISKSPSNREVAKPLKNPEQTSVSPSICASYSHFKPNTKTFIELTPSPTPYDLQSKGLQRDIDSLKRLIDFEGLQEKAVKAKKQFKTLVKNNLKSVTNDRDDLMDVTFKTVKPHQYSNKFFAAVKKGDIEEVISLLIDFPGLVRETDSTQQTALHWACRRRNLDMVKLLISSNTNCMARDIVGRKAEDIAKIKGFVEIFSYLHAVRRRSGQNISRLGTLTEDVQTYSFHALLRMQTRVGRNLEAKGL